MSLLSSLLSLNSSEDRRYNNFHIIDDLEDVSKWSTEWNRFPGLAFALRFELYFRQIGNHLQRWMDLNWSHSIWISAIYLLIIFTLKKFMDDRKPFELRRTLAAWSGLLTVFSIVGTIRCLPEFVDVFLKKGFERSFCEGSYYKDIRLTSWYLVFVWSKAFELGDTIFIVLRKQKLHPLHWIHHVLTLVFSWFVFGDVPATARWMVTMNFVVHSVMYLYFALRALKVSIPRPVAVGITSIQIIQMLCGFYVHARAYHFKMTGQKCDVSVSVAQAGFALYSIFFVLFLHFFVNAYVRPIIKRSNLKLVIRFSSDTNNNRQAKCFLSKHVRTNTRTAAKHHQC